MPNRIEPLVSNPAAPQSGRHSTLNAILTSGQFDALMGISGGGSGSALAWFNVLVSVARSFQD